MTYWGDTVPRITLELDSPTPLDPLHVKADTWRPLRGARVLAVIATSLVGGVVCGSVIGWFLRFIKCSGRAWLLGSSSMMLRSQLAVIANRAAIGWLRRAGSDLVVAEA
jgi:hypothetical protein